MLPAMKSVVDDECNGCDSLKSEECVCGLQPCRNHEFYHDSASNFIEAFNNLANLINQTAIEKGWWKGDRNEGEIIALIHSELSEALDGLRHGNPPSDHIPEFSAVEEEYADVIIRIMDMAPAKGYRIGEALAAKVAFNRTRPYKHGGKRF